VFHKNLIILMINLELARFDFLNGLSFQMSLILLLITLALAQFHFLKGFSVSY
jgi:hypothetical protein